MNRVPADFVINARVHIVIPHYGRKLHDHLAFGDIEAAAAELEPN